MTRVTGPDMPLFWAAFLFYLAATVGACAYAGLRSPRVRKAAYWLTVAGLAANTVALVVRSALSGHPPVTNLFEYMTFFAWATVVAFVLLWRRRGAELLTVFGAAVALGLMVIASLVPESIERQLIPALQSYWLWIHVSLAVLAEAAFAVAFVASILYLRRREGDPDRDALDDVAHRAVGIGFPLFTIGALFAGAIWAARAWGTPWSWDPKETSSLVVWLIYAAYLHVRLARRNRRAAAVISIVGFAATIFTVLGSKILGGLHAYA
jgi:ABC-type transport system involved in cytochrome c biogenesis permease subunit